MSFAQRVAEDMGIPSLVFWTTSACGFMGYLHFAELVRRGYVPLKGTRQIALVLGLGLFGFWMMKDRDLNSDSYLCQMRAT
jgi:hypothetical protein